MRTRKANAAEVQAYEQLKRTGAFQEVQRLAHEFYSNGSKFRDDEHYKCASGSVQEV